MAKRFVSIWFRYLATDLVTVRHSEYKRKPIVLKTASHGRMIIAEANAVAEKSGIHNGMVLADARAIEPGVLVKDDNQALTYILLKRIADYCLRFTPSVTIEPPASLILEATGCTHLWGGEKAYLYDIANRFKQKGFYVQAGLADTIGAAWAVTRYSMPFTIVEEGKQAIDIKDLPPAALRLPGQVTERLNDLGLRQIGSFMNMPHKALRRRFGNEIVQRLNQAVGIEEEVLQTIQPVVPWQERLPCFDPIVTAEGIAIALRKLLQSLCSRLQQEQKGLRKAILKCYRVDGKIQHIEIATHRPSGNETHLFRLFEMKISTIEPGLGIELFILEAPVIEDHSSMQQDIWKINGVWNDNRLSELIDRMVLKIGRNSVKRFLPDEHYWPERSYKTAASLQEQPTTSWSVPRPRPIQILPKPEVIHVTAPVPDYPPMNFRYKGKLHKVIKADGPERIEQEWWIEEGQHRDYYVVEDEVGCRYWLFRSGHYNEEYKWFVHGFFA